MSTGQKEIQTIEKYTAATQLYYIWAWNFRTNLSISKMLESDIEQQKKSQKQYQKQKINKKYYIKEDWIFLLNWHLDA